MVIICGARKSFFLIIFTYGIAMEVIDLQQEILSFVQRAVQCGYRKLFIEFNNQFVQKYSRKKIIDACGN
jgi:hypothetical protein